MRLVPHRVSILVGLCSAAPAAWGAPCPPPDVTQQAAEIIDGGLALCGDPAAPCWRIDAATGAWTRASAPPRPSIVVTPSKITACAAGGADCVTVSGTFAEAAQATASDDRSRIAVWSGATVTVHDTRTGTPLSTIRGWKSPMGPAAAAQVVQVRFVGPALAVWQAWTPVSSAARLFDPRTGRRIADVGKAGAEIEPWAVPLAGDRWAFAGFDPKLYVVNVKTGKVTRTIKLPGGQGGRSVPGTLADGRVAIVGDGVVLVDVARGKAAPLSTACRE